MINSVILYDIMANHMSEYESIFSDVAVYNNMINGPDQAEMTVSILHVDLHYHREELGI